MGVYLENCLETVAGFNTEAIAQLQIGECIGAGSQFEFRLLGKIASGTTEHYTGLKIPHGRVRDAYTRLMGELTFVDFCTTASPDLLPLVPTFMGLLEVEGGDKGAMAIITEDVSRGGSTEVLSTRASQNTRHLIYEPFAKQGSMDEVCRGEEEFNNSLAFDVDGKERLLDFTPLPIGVKYWVKYSPYKKHQSKVFDSMDDLTLTIPSISVLGESLLNPNLE